jgi:hypothetical protein
MFYSLEFVAYLFHEFDTNEDSVWSGDEIQEIYKTGLDKGG